MGEAKLTSSNHQSDWPAGLKQALKNAPLKESVDYRPVLIEMSTAEAENKLGELLEQRPIVRVVDNYDEQLAELYISQNAQLYKANLEVKQNSIKDYLANHYGKLPAWQRGSWVYYPWSGLLVHALERDLFWQSRTIRNKNLVTDDEQQKYRNIRVGCAGMSVGSNGAIAIALTGGSEKIKLADGAVLSSSNLNRVRAGIGSVGANKAMLAARQLYEMNPYIEVEAVTQNLDGEAVASFFESPWPIDVLVEEIDDFEMKVRLRQEAKKRGIPVIMVTEPGDTIMLDVERFDLDRGLPLFHGLAPGVEEVIGKEVTQRERIKYFSKIIGINNLPLRDQQSMLQVGATLPSPPQLGSTAMAAGGVIAYAVRKLALEEPLKSGRNIMSLDEAFLNISRQERKTHKKHSKSMSKALGSM